jgi:tRNA G18 (ribose-2'-O)-methylase SpoU
MGSLFRVPLAGFDEAPGPQVALLPRDGRPLAELDFGKRVTFVLGAERTGLPDDVVARCDEVASIPIAAGAESLNVAVAGALALYELARRATQTESSPPAYGPRSNHP